MLRFIFSITVPKLGAPVPGCPTIIGPQCGCSHTRMSTVIEPQGCACLGLATEHSAVCSCVYLGMSKEAGELYPGASPQPQTDSAGYTRAASTSDTAIGTEMATGDTVHHTMDDSSRIGAWHRHLDAKENIASALNPAYSSDKVLGLLLCCEKGLLFCCRSDNCPLYCG